MHNILIGLGILLITAGCCHEVRVPVPIPITKVALPEEPKCERTTDKSTDKEVVLTALQCIDRKAGYIAEIKTRLREFIK